MAGAIFNLVSGVNNRLARLGCQVGEKFEINKTEQFTNKKITFGARSIFDYLDKGRTGKFLTDLE